MKPKKKKSWRVRLGLWLIGDKNYKPKGPREKKGKEEGKDE